MKQTLNQPSVDETQKMGWLRTVQSVYKFMLPCIMNLVFTAHEFGITIPPPPPPSPSLNGCVLCPQLVSTYMAFCLAARGTGCVLRAKQISCSCKLTLPIKYLRTQNKKLKNKKGILLHCRVNKFIQCISVCNGHM